MPELSDRRRLARRISTALFLIAALFPFLLFFPAPVTTQEEPQSVRLASNLAFEAMLLGLGLTLRFPRLELPFLIAKACLSFLMAIATVWQTFEAPFIRIGGSVAMFLAYWSILPKEPDFLSQLDE